MPKAFTDELRDLRKGGLVQEATDRLAELVNAVTATGKPGKFTLELSLKRVGRGAVTVTDKISVKNPEPQTDNQTLMFPGPEGSLFTEDPAQSKLDLKVAPSPAVEPLKSAAQSTEPLKVATP